MADAPEPCHHDDEEPYDPDDSALMDAAMVYDSQTERLKVYGSLLRAMLPRIGTATRLTNGAEPEVHADVHSYRNLALCTILADIRRIAGDGMDIRHTEEADER